MSVKLNCIYASLGEGIQRASHATFDDPLTLHIMPRNRFGNETWYVRISEDQSKRLDLAVLANDDRRCFQIDSFRKSQRRRNEIYLLNIYLCPILVCS